VPTGTIILLGAFAGLTIFFGLPLAFLKKIPPSLKIFLCMLATGVLIFLLYDVIQKASEPINAAIEQVRTLHTGTGILYLDIFLLVFGVGIGSVAWSTLIRLSLDGDENKKSSQKRPYPRLSPHRSSLRLRMVAMNFLRPPLHPLPF